MANSVFFRWIRYQAAIVAHFLSIKSSGACGSGPSGLQRGQFGTPGSAHCTGPRLLPNFHRIRDTTGENFVPANAPDDRADRAGDKRPTFTTIASLLQNRVLSCV